MLRSWTNSTVANNGQIVMKFIFGMEQNPPSPPHERVAKYANMCFVGIVTKVQDGEQCTCVSIVGDLRMSRVLHTILSIAFSDTVFQGFFC